jgi:hypothetical protein
MEASARAGAAEERKDESESRAHIAGRIAKYENFVDTTTNVYIPSY